MSASTCWSHLGVCLSETTRQALKALQFKNATPVQVGTFVVYTLYTTLITIMLLQRNNVEWKLISKSSMNKKRRLK